MKRDLEPPGDSVDRALCATTSRLLAASSTRLGTLGLGCALLAAAALLLHPPAIAAYALLAVLVLTAGERVLAFRLHFDAGLFADLAHEPAADGAALDALDHALQTLQLRPAAAVPRPLHDRVAGARRLVVWHAATAAAQFAALLLAAVANAHAIAGPWGAA